MSDLVKFKNANLPSVTAISAALKSVKSNISVGDGAAILKMDKTGCWVYGAEQTDVEDDSHWAVNPFSFVHGYIAWGSGEVLGEKMGPITEPLPEPGSAPPNAKKGWEQQIGCSFMCISGEDKGLEARYSVTSVGGKRALSKLAEDIALQIENDPTKPVPVVTLGSEHYPHKEWGKVFTPVLKIVDWIAMDGSSGAAAPVAAPEAEPEQPQRRRRRQG